MQVNCPMCACSGEVLQIPISLGNCLYLPVKVLLHGYNTSRQRCLLCDGTCTVDQEIKVAFFLLSPNYYIEKETNLYKPIHAAHVRQLLEVKYLKK